MPDDRVGSKAGYEPEFFEHLVRAEDRHFWFRHRNRVITDAVEALVRRSCVPNLTLTVAPPSTSVATILSAASKATPSPNPSPTTPSGSASPSTTAPTPTPGPSLSEEEQKLVSLCGKQ